MQLEFSCQSAKKTSLLSNDPQVLISKNSPMPKKKNTSEPPLSQDPHQLKGVGENSLEAAIGYQVKEFRSRQGFTVAELARQAGLSLGMLSKIENGQTSASLSTLQSLSRALNVPVTALFKRFEEKREATFIKAGEGLDIERRGTRAGHAYKLLGHALHKRIIVEPYIITLDESSDSFPLFQHEGLEFIYVLEGQVQYRHGDQIYNMGPGDSLYFDSDAPHGPEELVQTPVKFLSLISYLNDTASD